jgi:NTE family protein
MRVPIDLKIGAVNIIDGTYVLRRSSEEHFLDYLMASSAVPILMPVVKINGETRRSFLDGGLRDVAPIKKAVDDGGKPTLFALAVTWNPSKGDILIQGIYLALVDRVMDIAVNEILNADINEVMLSNTEALTFSRSDHLSHSPLTFKISLKWIFDAYA